MNSLLISLLTLLFSLNCPAMEENAAFRHSSIAAKTLTQAESSAVTKINNILTKNFKPGPKGDISGAVH